MGKGALPAKNGETRSATKRSTQKRYVGKASRIAKMRTHALNNTFNRPIEVLLWAKDFNENILS